MVGCRLTDKSDSAELDRSSKQRINKDKLSIESNKYTDSKTDNKDKESKSALWNKNNSYMYKDEIWRNNCNYKHILIIKQNVLIW